VCIISYLRFYAKTTRHLARFRPDTWRISDPTLGKEVAPEVLQVLQQKTAAPTTGAAVSGLARVPQLQTIRRYSPSKTSGIICLKAAISPRHE
jgi:hypothetical protein